MVHAGELAPLSEGAAALGIALDDAQLVAFARYRDLLLEWNQRFNLTAITDPREVLTRHFLDSLTVASALPAALREGQPRLLDVGSGAGFPGLALAIAFPAWRVTALEATGKKVGFLEHVIATLGLRQARALAGRAEELAHVPAERGRYEVVTARAVAALPVLLEYCQPFARPGGLVVAPKKGDLTAELAAGRIAAATLGGRLEEPVPVAAPGLEDGRVVVVVRQQQPTPPRYPRAGGAPARHPLGGQGGGADA